MELPTLEERRARFRQILLLREPMLWPNWPFLPVVRQKSGQPECGLLFDAKRVSGRYGYSATVFLGSLLRLPTAFGDLRGLSREVFDTAEEIYAAGWRVA